MGGQGSGGGGGGEQGVGTPLKNHKNIGFLSKTGLDPLEITKLPSWHSMLGHICPPAKCHLNGISLAGQLWPAYSDIRILSSQLKKKKQHKKTLSVLDPLWQNFLDPHMLKPSFKRMDC